MRYPIAIALLISCATFSAHAADDSSNPCSLLDWQDFQTFGVVKDTAMTESGWHQEETPKALPDSQLFTDMCAVAVSAQVGRSSVTLSFDSFKGKVTEQQVGEWLKSGGAEGKVEKEQPDVAIVKVGDATCETGQYDLPTLQADDSVVNIMEHYIACDQQVGIQHVSLNIHVPEGNKVNLPSPAQAKALLDKSIDRMKQNEFSAPDNKI